MRHLERRLQRLEELCTGSHDGPTLAERLREKLRDAHERRRLGLPKPEISEGEGPIWERYQWAVAKAEAARSGY